jgi:hypothetical protein
MIEVEQFDNEAPAPLVLGDDSLLLCNEPPSRFWMHSGYKEQDVHRLCSEINKEWMFAMVTFHGEGKLSFSVSQRTWDRGEGHYPVVMELFRAVANDPRLVNARGSFVVWLEDGMWDWCQPFSRRAPVVAFGRNVRDSTTFLMPDPAFIGALGYSLDRKQAERFAAQIGWSHRRPTIFWRGAATGIGIEGPEWSQTTRSKLVLEAKKIGDRGVVDAKLTRIGHLPHEAKQILLSEGVVDEEVPFDTFFNFKYVVDADGYHCAWKSLYLKLMMGSVVLKMDSSFEQWYHRNLMPWRHYIPMSKDLKELREIHQWLLNHDEAAQEISRAGADFISKVNLESALDGMVMIVENILGAWRE